MKNFKKTAAIATVMAMTFSLGQVYADTAAPVASTQLSEYMMPSLGKVNISSSASFELMNVQELEQTTDKIVSFTLRLSNKSTQRAIDFKDYWIRVKSKSGSNFTVNQVSANKEKEKVAAESYQDFRFYAKVNKTTTLSDLQFALIAWDFTASDFERELGTLSLPSTYKPSVPVNHSFKVISDKTNFHSLIKRVATGKNDKKYLPSITIVMQNAGTQAATGLNFQFQLRSKSGLFYPLKSTVTDTTVFNPLEKKELLLSGVIPVEAGGDGWKLVLTQTITNDKGSVTVPLASYDLPATTAEDVSIGSEQTFSTEDGTYTAIMTSLTRVPWDDEDILISNVSIQNKGTSPMPVPSIEGTFELDDVVDEKADMVQFDKVLTIAPNTEVNVQFYSKIPYTYTFDKIALTLKEKSAEGEPATDLLNFHHTAELMTLPSVAVGSTHAIEGVGKRASVKVRQADTFTSPSAKLVTATIDATNLEKRYTETGSYVGQFKTPDGSVYPATIVKPVTEVAPNGKALLSFQASVPLNVDATQLQLLFGEAVETTTTPANGDPTTTTSAYVNAVELGLPKQNTAPKDNFKELDVYPYKISFEKFGTQINFTENKVELDFNYTLERDFMVEAETKDRRIVIEIEDLETSFKLTHELKLDNGSTSTEEEKAGMLELGTHSMELTKVDEDIKYELENLENYRLNIYDQIKPGYKKLIATKEIRWFTISQ
ncbi:hypothetical protein MO973_24685 [Paenibacillus sp. TRM 82003]|nr:hypothetical protein [Paenibacillus sp. TRM 82003]MCI3923428.1 hypothetical protein [Paenibacillus sp. TRM 82003]